MLLLKNARSSFVRARYLAQQLCQKRQRTVMNINTNHVASKVLHRQPQMICNFCSSSRSTQLDFQVLSFRENVRGLADSVAPRDCNLQYRYGTTLEGHHARDIYNVAISAVEPLHMIRKVLQYDADQSILTVKETQYKLNRNVYVIGFGKAVLGMGRAVEDILGEHIVRGILSIPTGQREVLRQEKKWNLLLQPHTKIEVYQGGKHNLPDENSFRASKAIEELVSGRKDTDLIIVLVSGGGSFLIPSPQSPISLEDLVVVTKVLEDHGASAKDINIVRKNIETLKRGGLVTAARPAKLVSLIISDIIGDDLGMISSGPTVYNQVTSHQCFEIFSRLKVFHRMPQTVLSYLQQQVTKETAKAMLGKGKPGSKKFVNPKGLEELEVPNSARIQNVLVGSITIACQAAARRAQELGYLPFILSTELEGEAREIGTMLAKVGIYTLMCFDRRLWSRAHAPFLCLELEIVKEGVSKTKLNKIANFVERAKNLGKSVAIIAGGESAVNVVGTGKGGQNQEVALAAAIQLHKRYDIVEPHAHGDITLLSADTDGEDGPCCSAAGAVVDQNFVRNAEMEGLSCQDTLKNNDSNTLFSMVNGGAHLVVTRMTGTKVMDIQVLIVSNPSGHSI